MCSNTETSNYDQKKKTKKPPQNNHTHTQTHIMLTSVAMRGLAFSISLGAACSVSHCQKILP